MDHIASETRELECVTFPEADSGIVVVTNRSLIPAINARLRVAQVPAGAIEFIALDDFYPGETRRIGIKTPGRVAVSAVASIA